MRQALLLAIAAYLLPVWGSPTLPTQDGASHVLNARIFRECEREGTREHEFYARRLAPVPNWTAQALLLGLTTVAPPDAAEKILASLYVIGLPLALVYFLSSLGLKGEGALFGLLLVFNRCFFLGFSNYLLSLVLYFVVLGAFVRWSEAPRPGDVARLALLLLLAWFTHLFGYLLAGFSLLWLAATGPGEKRRRLVSVALALVPSAMLTVAYLGASGFFDAAVARRAARGIHGLDTSLPAVLHRELFAVYADAWPLGLLGLVAAALCAGLAWTKREDGGASVDRGGWRRSLGSLAAVLLLAFVFVPDHLGAQGGFLKARLAPVPFLLGLGLLPEAPRGGSRSLAIVPLLLLLGFNLFLVGSHFGAANRDLEEFEAAKGFVRPGETLLALKPRLEPPPLVDVRAAERYCLEARAVCLGNYEAATRHFPVRLRPGVKERLKQNRPGTFWADVLLAWEASDDQLPRPEEPYREVYRRGALRMFRRELPPAEAQAKSPPRPHVDSQRLQSTLEKLSEFGRGPEGGVTRIGFSETDLAARDYVTSLMKQAGLEVRVDPAGNLFGRRKGSLNLPTLLFGSHIDSVPHGGNFDGDVGSMGAIEVVRALNEGAVKTRHPLEVVVWSNEEGHHFGLGTLGSGVAAGLLGPEILERKDEQGLTLADWLRRYGQDPSHLADARIPRGGLAGYLELHIEQGPILAETKVPIGVVQGIVGLKRWKCVATGFANHAGTTPMSRRQDALAAASRDVLAVRDAVRAEAGGQVGTVGYMKAEPGAINVIPGRVEFPVELRDLDAEKIDRVWKSILERFREIDQEEGVLTQCTKLDDVAPARTDPALQTSIREAARAAGLATSDLPSGAVQDAQQIAKIAPIGMIFVPSRDGISHSPKEFTSWPDVANGAEVLYRSLLLLDDRLNRN